MTNSEIFLNVHLFCKGTTYKVSHKFGTGNTLKDVRTQCSLELGVPIENFKALYKGKSLDKDLSLNDIGINDGDQINIVCFERPSMSHAEITDKFHASATVLANQTKEGVPSLILHKKLLLQFKEVVDYMDKNKYERSAEKYKLYRSLLNTLESLQVSFKATNLKLKALVLNKPEIEQQEDNPLNSFASQIGNMVTNGLGSFGNLFQTGGLFPTTQTTSNSIQFREPNLHLKTRLKNVFKRVTFYENTSTTQIINQNKDVLIGTLSEELLNGELDWFQEVIEIENINLAPTVEKLRNRFESGEIGTCGLVQSYCFLIMNNKNP